MAGDEQRAIDAGCDAYLSKPVSYESFRATIGQVLAQG